MAIELGGFPRAVQGHTHVSTARCIRRPLNAHHAPQPHVCRTYVPRHHDAGVVHHQPNEPHDPEEPEPVDQPHARRTYVPRHHDAGVVHPQPNEPHDPEEPEPVDQPHARRTYVPRHHDAGVVHPQPTNHTTQKNPALRLSAPNSPNASALNSTELTPDEFD
jgi:hypothetical protein